MNNQQVREIAEAAFKAHFGDIGIVGIDIEPGFDHYDDPLVEVRIIYDAAFEDLRTESAMRVRSEIIDKVWRNTKDSPGWPQVHFIAKSDLEEEDPARCSGLRSSQGG